MTCQSFSTLKATCRTIDAQAGSARPLPGVDKSPGERPDRAVRAPSELPGKQQRRQEPNRAVRRRWQPRNFSQGPDLSPSPPDVRVHRKPDLKCKCSRTQPIAVMPCCTSVSARDFACPAIGPFGLSARHIAIVIQEMAACIPYHQPGELLVQLDIAVGRCKRYR